MKKCIPYYIAVTIFLFCSGCSLSRLPSPADFYCLNSQKDEGRLLLLDIHPKYIYGIGLTYAAHFKETGFEFDPDKSPPVFKKELISLKSNKRFLKPGDIVKVSGGILGEVKTRIVER